MDVELLAGTVAALLAQGAAQGAGESAWNGLARVTERLTAAFRSRRHSSGVATLDELIAKPDDTKVRLRLERQLVDLFGADAQVARDVANLVEQLSGSGSPNFSTEIKGDARVNKVINVNTLNSARDVKF